MSNLTGPIHTWTLKDTSLLIRWYRYLYEDTLEMTNTRNLSFCKLFWGTVLSPIVALILAIVMAIYTPIAWVVKGIKKLLDNSAYEHRVAEIKKAVEPPAPKVQRRTQRVSIANKIVAAVSHFFDNLAAWSQRHTNGLHFIGGVLIWVFFIALVLATGGTGLYFAVNHYNGLLTGLKWAGIGFGGGLAVAATLYGVFWVLLKIRIFDRMADLVERACHKIFIDGLYGYILKPIGRLFAQIGRFFRGAYLFFIAGEHAVKYRTCPMIQIVHETEK